MLNKPIDQIVLPGSERPPQEHRYGESSNFNLVQVVPSDAAWITESLTHWHVSSRWSMRGQTPSPQMVDARLWHGVVRQHTIRDAGGRACALVQVAEPDFRNEHATLNLIIDPSYMARLSGPVKYAAERALHDLPLRKLSISYPADQTAIELCIEPIAVASGRLVDHERYGPDKYVDVVIADVWKQAPS